MEKLKTDYSCADSTTMTTPFSLYDDLIEALGLEISLCYKLFDVVERKLDAIVKVDAEVIATTVSEEECLASQLSDMTARRMGKTEEVAVHLQAAKSLRLGELLEYMGPDDRAKIGSLRAELIEIGTKVKHINDMNKKILEESQQRIGDYFRQASQKTDGTYTAAGENANRQVSFFNAEA